MRTDIPAFGSIATLVQRQAQARPGAPALLAPGRTALSYAELHAQVMRLGDHLHAMGATPRTRVAVVLPNGPEMAVAFLGLAANAACAPLNPAYQAAELQFGLQDTRADMLLMQRGAPGPAREVALELGLKLIEIEVDDAGPAGRFRVVAELPHAEVGAACGPNDVALLLHTSGTTARPKLVPLSQANLMASAHHIAAHLGLSARDRCLNVMPLFHIHGLVGALLATLAGGGSIVCTPGFDDQAYFDWIARFDPSWTTAVPTIHQAVLAHGAAYRQKAPTHRFRFVRSSSAALPAATLRALQALLKAPVVEAYGMTEASHQMASNPVQAGEQTAGCVGVAAGAQIVILDVMRGAEGRPLGVGQAGEVAIRGPGVMGGYENNLPANAEAFHDGWFRTGDLGHLDALGRLYISGRLKEIVNRGGEKVSPREVDDALLEHPGVVQAAAFGVPHPSLGEDLAAAVVRRAGSTVDEAALRDFLFARLAGFKVPSQIVFVHAIPAGATGKVQRGGLHRLLGAALKRAFVAPQTSIERALAPIFSEVLECGPLGVHDNFFAQGGDSLKGARVIARVNSRFGLDLPATSLFRHPSVGELAAQVQLPEQSPDVANTDDVMARPLLPRQHGDTTPCSFSQEALWIVERLAGGSGVYNIAQAVRITGALDVPALDQALQALLQRHEVLRTAFEERDGVPVQVLHAKASAPLSLIDVRGLGRAGSESALQQRLGEHAQQPFDLTTAPLLRASLWRVDEDAGESTSERAGEPDHVLLLVVHHLVADGWSMQVIARELSALYTAFSAGQAPPPPPIQFADWALWQRERLQSDAGKRAGADLRYWRGWLAGLAPLAFPTDRPRPPQLSYAGRSERLTVAADLLSHLKTLAREHDVTLFMLLLAAFKVLLMRYSQQDDVAVGSPVAGRDRPELEGLVGFFVNSVVLRTDLSGNPSFSELLARVRQTALDAYTHQALPFDRLVAELSPQRDLGRNPLYQVSFALNNQPAAVYALQGVTTRPMALQTQTAKFDLSLSFAEENGELHGIFEYSTDLFERSTVQRLTSHLQNLLAGVAADAGQRLAQLPLMSGAELQQVLVGWNRTGRSFTNNDPVHTLVERQAMRTPDALALVFGDQRLSYRELNAQANRLAHHLRSQGVAPEVPVAVCLERSLPLVVALLAVLKAGGALVPLDPALPPERLAFMLQDTSAPLVLTHSSLANRLAPPGPDHARTLLCLDTQWHEIAEGPEDNPPAPTAPTDLACVIYTSGSTGQPKGVLLEHRGWSNHVGWMQQTLRVVPGDRFLQIASIGFDAALVELFMPLQVGATLVLAAPGEHRDTAYLAQLVRDQAVTVLQMVPSALRSLLAEPRFAAGSLRYVICGGEALDHGLANELQRRLPAVTLGNFYGPTETAIDATHHELPRSQDGLGAEGGVTSVTTVTTGTAGTAGTAVTIGRPIANTQCYVLDRHLQPVPVGVTGELFIGGVGLARGYLNRPALTAERFIAHPFVAGQRLYRSGDLARFRANGDIEFLGRSDLQVKIRGHRIELGEIEAALKAQAGVRDAVVLAREDAPGLKRLVAYVAATGIGAAELKAALARQLPEAMLPAAFVLLPQLPTLPNGKLDRQALPAPAPADRTPATAPRTDTEHAIRQIWRDVLNIEHVGVHDHFFELGGHSLLATQVIARLRAGLHIELPLRTIFEHPTLEALAAEIDRILAGGRHRGANGDGLHTALVAPSPIPNIGRDGALAVSYSQRRMWLVQTLNPQTTAYNMTFALRLQGRLNGAALTEAVDWVVQRHEAFRTRFALVDGEVVQFIGPPRRVEMTQIDLRRLPLEQREREAQAHRHAQAGQRFDLSAAGLYRVSLLQMDEAEHVLLWVIHHAIGDHWSDGILLRELGHAYGELLHDRTPSLPALRLEYADYAAWQRAPAQRDALAPQMAFWKGRMQGAEPLQLPQDLEWRELPSGRGGSVSARLSGPALSALKRFSTQHGATPFMAMLACFKLVLSRCTGQLDIVVGSPVANRKRLESESLVGTLVNTLVMRTDLSGEPTFAELLARVKETALDAFAHQDAPFERLVEELHADRGAARLPLVQVLFNVINAPFDVNAMPGLSLAPFQFESSAAQFDLALTVDDVFGEVRLTYSTDLFVRPTAERMLASFMEALALAMADPSRRVDDWVLLHAAEQATLREWNRTDAPLERGFERGFERGMTVAAFIAAGMAPQASRTALRSGTERLSGAELQARAAQLARALRQRGVGRGSLVGLCLPRSVDMVVAQLAILASGAAYVPLDPAYPAERLAYMASDARLALLVSDSPLAALLGWPAERSLLLDVEASFIASLPATSLPPDALLDAQPDDPAYVIYTSGSTGRPKGVVVPQRAVVNFLASMAREPGLQTPDVLVAVTTLSFDIAVLELLLPLSVAAELVLAGREQALDGRALRALLEASGATVMQATPSTWRMLVEAGWQGTADFKALIGGEGLPPDLAQQLLARCGELWNLYGPTETTVWSSCWKVAKPEQGIRIGRPIANTQVHVLDGRGQPCPIGAAGELFIGGAGVALGYLHRPELTAERFVADPFSAHPGAHPGARLYRTGDRGRWCHDGLLEHLGRLDAQVKLRGHRIEPGEIEAALMAHAQVARAVVIVREDAPGDARLVAYMVARAEPPSPAALREHLRASLPEYMLPQHFVPMAALPLLPNGKLDRRGLPAPDRADYAVADRRRATRDAPQTEAETVVAQVWQGLLGIGPIARSDNFFDLGGHSLLAIRAVFEMERQAGLRVELRRLVHESLAQIAADLGEAAGEQQHPPPPRRRLFKRLLDGIGLSRTGGAP